MEARIKAPSWSVTNELAAADVLFAGYVFVATSPDRSRYIRIGTMESAEKSI